MTSANCQTLTARTVVVRSLEDLPPQAAIDLDSARAAGTRSNRTVSLVRSQKGEPKHFISIVEDISEGKRVEARRDSQGRAVKTFDVLRDVSGQEHTERELRSLSRRLLQANENEPSSG